ncbi:hypothetical protein [Aureispira anguillae]|uniref:Lipoprotein n=1 Tax=Aureispira anguillae TaxID=2864201 RepID=A0A915YIZ4_9BACT|nr:hypothetical protein [Aureispira anguillae]BDS13879.1 hypothetical protein AsAng_0046420 [Aureispira anguillae]
MLLSPFRWVVIVFGFSVLTISCEQNNFADNAIAEFFGLDERLKQSNRLITYSTDNTIYHMREMSYEHPKYQFLVDQTIVLRALTDTFCRQIDELREFMVMESGGFYTPKEASALGIPTLEGKPKGVNNKKIINAIFLTGYKGKAPQGEILRSRIEKLKDAYLLLVEQFWKDGGIKGTVFAVSDRKKVLLEALEMELALSTKNAYPLTSKVQDWANFTFQQQSIASVYPLLRAIQNQAKLSEAAVVNFMASKMTVGCTYDAYELFEQPMKRTIVLGESYETEFFLGQYASQANFTVSIQGQTIKSKNGKAIYKTIPKKVGEQNYTARVAVTNSLTGETESFIKEFTYEVIQPH